MKTTLLATALATMSIAGTARADSDSMLPVQGDLDVTVASGSRVLTSGVYLDLSFVQPIKPVGGGWTLFAGVGLADDVVTYWQRDDRRAPDAIGEGIHAPGIEGRLGLVHGTQLGAPRLVVKATPMWARGVDAMGFPGERGVGLRASVGIAWPAWLLGSIEPDAPGTRSDEQTYPYAIALAALIPSKIEYVFSLVPGDTHHGVAVGWSF